MMRSLIAGLLLATAANVASATLLAGRGSHAGPLNSFETSCFHVEDPAGESGGAKGRSYRGLVSSTISGRTCQKWTSDHPWKDAAALTPTSDEESDEGLMTWGNGIGNHNYCRNPDSRNDSPWCYTMDPSKDHEWEPCDVPECPAKTRNFPDEAKELSTKIESEDCGCGAQLYGSSKTTGNTAVSLLAKGKKCHC